MTHDELERLSKQELVELILLQAAQLAELRDAFLKLKADYEALKMKFDSNRRIRLDKRKPFLFTCWFIITYR